MKIRFGELLAPLTFKIILKVINLLYHRFSEIVCLNMQSRYYLIKCALICTHFQNRNKHFLFHVHEQTIFFPGVSGL